MKLTIDNGDGRGPQDYTSFLDAGERPRVTRKLNHPSEARFSLIGDRETFVVPANGARVTLGRTNGSDVFAGYVTNVAAVYRGWMQDGPLYRYEIIAASDESRLDKKALLPQSPFVARSAGEALRHLTQETLPGWGNFDGVENGDVIPYYRIRSASKWSEVARDICLLGRSAYRIDGERLIFSPLGANAFQLNEHSPEFSPGDLELWNTQRVVNDVAVLGQLEPNGYVRDYFVGDGFTTRFYLSQIPFTRTNRVIVDEEFATLDSARWKTVDPAGAIEVANGKLQVKGGTGIDGETRLEFGEKVELGGAIVFQHGDIEFTAASDGIVGGLYDGSVSLPECIAGFRVTPSGTSCRIQAVVDGVPTGTTLTTQAGHRYVLATRLYANEVYRMEQVFHSDAHPAGAGLGGGLAESAARIVLEVHEIDPADPATLVAPALVLFDSVLPSAPAFATYALINARSMHCDVTFTRVALAVGALVRSTAPQQNSRTRRPGSLLEGADCRISEEPALQFYPQYAPLANETIEVTYRGRGRARARVRDAASIVEHASGFDDGVRGRVAQVEMPETRTSGDCEAAAQILLEGAGQGWVGQYRAWSPFLPGGAADIFPGDGLVVDIPSQTAKFPGIVNGIDIEIVDVAGENCRYTLRFVDAGDPSLGLAFGGSGTQSLAGLTAIDTGMVGTWMLPNVASAGFTNVTSTTVTIDVGVTPAAGEGIEVRRSDAGWGADNDRNLVGRFNARSFTLSRYGRVQDFFLRRFDSSSPPKYSRYSTVLHLDWPL